MSSHKRKRNPSDKGFKHIPVNIKRNIERQFEKKFAYGKPMPDNEIIQDIFFKLPISNPKTLQQIWEIESYVAMKNELNELKNNLNDKDMLSWHHHTRRVNLAGNIAPEIRHRLRPELCTQAWCKFFEIASTYLKINCAAPYFSVHLCEAPGAFVTSMNQYLLTIGYQSEWDWVATTLNPYYEGNHIGQMIDDDRFIRCSRANWYFGDDGTGNLMSEKNLQALQDMVKDSHVDLVTADGSIDCQGDPAEQENVVSRLQHCEALTALQILSPGGTFVMKTFTMFECRSICLMYLLNCLFDKVNVFKPCTSKGGNSEVYVVCLGYNGRGDNQEYLDGLTALYFGEKEPEGCLFAMSDIPAAFFDQHSKCTEFFKDCQMTSIQRNLDLFKVTEEQRSVLEMEKGYCVECFFARYDVKPMVKTARIMKFSTGQKNHTHFHNKKTSAGNQSEFAVRVKLEGKFIGSYQERRQLSVLPWKQKIYKFDTYEDEVDKEDNSLWIQCLAGPFEDSEINNLGMSTGKHVHRIDNSRFCHGYFIAQSQEIIQNAQWLTTQPEMDAEFLTMIAQRLTSVINTSLQLHSQRENVASVGAKGDSGWWECPTSGIGQILSCGKDNVSVKLFESKHEAETVADSIVDKVVHSGGTDINSCTLEEGREDMHTHSVKEDNAISESVTEHEKQTELIEIDFEGRDRENVDSGQKNGELDSIKDTNKENFITEMEVEEDSSALKASQSNGTLNHAEFVCVCKNEPSQVFRLMPQSVHRGRDTEILVYNVTSDDGVDERFELKEQQKLCETALDILQNAIPGRLVVIEMGTCLTRVTAGLVYILYRSFKEIGFVHHHGNLLKRHMVCVSYQHCPMRLQQYLKEACQLMCSGQSEAVLEIFPIHTLLDDADFSTFLHISNSNLLQSFITTAINKEKQLCESN